MTPFPQVPEADAPPDIAAIYAEIRALSGITVVNLIWRHFAALPGALPWVWQTVSPILASPSIDTARQSLIAEVTLAPLPPVDAAAWHTAGVSDTALAEIAAMTDTYISFTVLQTPLTILVSF